jgi:hypothetical protein
MEGTAVKANVAGTTGEISKKLFWTCFIALVATSFGFIIRANIIGDLGVHFNLSETIDQEKVAALSQDEKQAVTTVASAAKKSAIETVAIFPAIMLVCYLILIFYFKARGGYKPVELSAQRE